jgi:integrase
MAKDQNIQKTLEDVRRLVESAETLEQRRRNGRSATERICAMAGVVPVQVLAEVPSIRPLLAKSRAVHDGANQTWANVLSRFRKELRLADVIDPNWQGRAARDPAWGPLVQTLAGNKRFSNGLAAFANWCAMNGKVPDAVDDDVFQHFPDWLENRTLCPNPKDAVRRVPRLWNEASERIDVWPKTKLTIISFKSPPKRVQWGDLSESFRADADAYLKMRAAPDIFEERPNTPKKPLAPRTLGAQSEHLRLAASVLVESGVPVEEITAVAVLVEVERFKTILRHYHERANRKPNAFAICLAKTLVQAAYHHVGLSENEVARLKEIAGKLPPVPLDLTPKNKALALRFESERLRAKLLFLPEQLIAEVARDLAQDRLLFVEAQVAVALDIDLVIPLRPQNLCSLNWRRHFSEPDGPKRRLLLRIPAQETKSKLQDLVAEIPDDVARRLRWYRRHILPRLGADPEGPLFVTSKGIAKVQETLSLQFTETIKRRLGVHLTLHQLRHLAAIWYLEENPEDFETPRSFLGHAWSKTTRVYAGSSTRRASKAYSRFVIEKRDALKLKRKPQLKRKAKKGSL